VFVDALKGGEVLALNASKLATDLTGDSIATNVLMVGYAMQKGLLPVSLASVEEAIRLNGTFVKGNLRTLALGRLAAHNPEALWGELNEPREDLQLDTLEGILASRIRLLTDYQDSKYADRYRSFVADVERRVNASGLQGSDLLVREVALTLAKLMAYKDEYEVARMHSDPKFWERLRTQFSGDFKVKFHLAPPMLPGRDASGRPRKREFGQWMLPVFRVLKSMKGLRGTAFDPFGYTAERRMERRLIEEYRALVTLIMEKLDASNLHAGIELAGAAYDVRGYGPVKDVSVEEYTAQKARLLETFLHPARQDGLTATATALPVA
jgi:indolepyruvate ferredoxin oxidoreductase